MTGLCISGGRVLLPDGFSDVDLRLEAGCIAALDGGGGRGFDARGLLVLPADRDAWTAFEPPREPQYALVSSLDALFALHRETPESHAIVDRGRLIGLWEYDIETESIAWSATVTPDERLRDAVARTEAYVREQLGDARSFSLDSPKSRAPRIAALRTAQP